MTNAPQAKKDHVSKIMVMPTADKSLAAPDMELGCLGAMILHPESYYDVRDMVAPHDFTDIFNVYVFKHIELIMEAHGQDLDEKTLAHAMLNGEYAVNIQQLGYADAAALQSAIDVIVKNTAPDTSNIKYYARQVADRAMRIRIINAAQNIMTTAKDIRLPLDTVATSVTDVILKATEQSARASMSVEAHAASYFDKLIEQSTNGNSQIIPYGLQSLADANIHLWRDTITVFVGSTGKGKTTIALGAAMDYAKQAGDDTSIHIFSYEMSIDEIMRNWFAMVSGLWRSKMLDPKTITPTDIQVLKTARENVSKWPAYLYDRSELKASTANEARRTIMRDCLSSGKSPGLIICDGLWLAQPNDGKKGESVAYYDKVINEWRDIAKEFNCAVLMLHQFRLDVENLDQNKRPNISHIDGQQYVSRSADFVHALHRVNDSAYVIPLKQRHWQSESSEIQLEYDKSRARYVDAQDTDDIAF